MIGQLREALAILRRFREGAGGRAAIDGLLSRARPTDPFEERLRWLAAVFAWISRPGRVDAEAAPPAHAPQPATPAHAPQPAPPARAPQATRLRHLLNVLDRNPEWKAGVAKTLRATLREMDALELFCETGLPREPAFWGEALERLLQRLLPADPGRRNLGRLLVSVFPDEESVGWLEQIDEETLARVAGLASFGREPGEPPAFAARP